MTSSAYARLFITIIDLIKQNGQPPARLQHQVDTYPILSLGDLRYLADFGLDEKSWIDVYIDGTFMSFRFHGDGSITVEKGRPVLIRLRPTLRDELTDCPGLAEYLEKQPKGRSKRKRSADALVSPIKPKTARLNLGSNALQSNQLIQIPSQSPTPELLDINLSLSSHSLSGTSMATSSRSAPSRPPQSTAMSKGKQKRTISRWPHDFYVSEIVNGLDQLKAMKDANKKSNLVTNFQEVFGLPYHKTTFAKYKGWIESDDEIIQDIIEAFVSEGAVDDSLWPMFADAVKDRIAVLEEENAKENEMNTVDILDDVDADDAKSTSGSEGSECSHTHRHGDETDSDDEITTRCPYCDERLPSTPTQQLTDMRTALEKKSVPDPLPGNPDHRKAASFKVYQDFCTRHRLELEDLPLARSEQWPEDLDMAEVHNRVSRLRSHLCLLFDSKILEDNNFFKNAKEKYAGIRRTRADGIDVQYGNFSGHGAG